MHIAGLESGRSQPEDSSISLSPEQQHVLQLVRAKQNVFFTGPAGAGKSRLLGAIIEMLRPSPHVINGVAVTASTGIAGLNIGGITIHSFAGIGYGKKPAPDLVKQIQKSLKLKMRWRTTRVLIIDEISMLDGKLFDKLASDRREYIARKIRGSEEPFGGIQLILSGDFFQLPPVPDQSFEYKAPPTFAFDATTWTKCIDRPIFLTKVFRQKDDAFVRILSNMRRGFVTPGDIEHLNALSRKVDYADGIEPSELFPIKNGVESCNQNRLAALPGPEYAYCAMDSAGYDITGLPITRQDALNLLDRVNTPAGILLKIGAQVMLTKNIKEGRLVNGSIGKISAFMTVTEAQEQNIYMLEQSPGRKDSENNQVPFSCIPNDEMRPLTGHIFSRREKWPVVVFPSKDSQNTLLCTPQEFTVEGPKGNIEARRIQVPLILAWAMSIHKSQGQTLERVRIDLGNIFEKGQAYVAISRATSMEGLELHNFEPSKVYAHPRVIAWQQFWEALGDGDWPEELDEDFFAG